MTSRTTVSIPKASGLTGRILGDVQSSMKETVNANRDHLFEDIRTGDGAGDLRGGPDEETTQAIRYCIEQ